MSTETSRCESELLDLKTIQSELYLLGCSEKSESHKQFSKQVKDSMQRQIFFWV